MPAAKTTTPKTTTVAPKPARDLVPGDQIVVTCTAVEIVQRADSVVVTWDNGNMTTHAPDDGIQVSS